MVTKAMRFLYRSSLMLEVVKQENKMRTSTKQEKLCKWICQMDGGMRYYVWKILNLKPWKSSKNLIKYFSLSLRNALFGVAWIKWLTD